MALAPIFRLIDFELVLYTVWDQGPTSFFSMWTSRCPRTICWRDYSLPIEWSQQPCWKLTIGWPSLAISVPQGTPPSPLNLILHFAPLAFSVYSPALVSIFPYLQAPWGQSPGARQDGGRSVEECGLQRQWAPGGKGAAGSLECIWAGLSSLHLEAKERRDGLSALCPRWEDYS